METRLSRGTNMHIRQAPEYAARTSLEPWQVPTLYGQVSNVEKRTRKLKMKTCSLSEMGGGAAFNRKKV